MDIRIELGQIIDIDEIEQLYNNLNDFLEKGMNYPGWIKGVYPVRQNAIDGVKQGNLFVAKQNGKIVGSIILNHEPEAAYNKAVWEFQSDYSDIIVIHTLAVHPDYLSCGIGKALIDFSITYANQTHARSIRLDVYEGNLPAIRLYEKCGFKYIDAVDLGYGSYGLDWFRLYERRMN